MVHKVILVTLLFLSLIIVSACGGNDSGSSDTDDTDDNNASGDADSDTDSDADADGDADSDADSDSDADADADADADGDTDSDSDTDADSDADSDTDADTDADTDTDADADADGDTDTDSDADSDSDSAPPCPNTCVAQGQCAELDGTYMGPDYSCASDTPICCDVSSADGDTDTDADTDTDTDADTDIDTNSDLDTDTGTGEDTDTGSDTQAAGPTEGSLTVTMSTSDAGGRFAPRHLLAVWIENDLGEFVHTLMAYTQAPQYKGFLTNWSSSTNDAGAQYDTTDAISGATLSSHGEQTATWDGTSYDNGTVADGTYNVCMELTDKNSTGNHSCFEITKGSTEESVTPGDEPSFSSVSITWSPD